MRLCGTRALALSQGLSSRPARPKSATGNGARLTVSAMSCHSPRFRIADSQKTPWSARTAAAGHMRESLAKSRC